GFGNNSGTASLIRYIDITAGETRLYGTNNEFEFDWYINGPLTLANPNNVDISISGGGEFIMNGTVDSAVNTTNSLTLGTGGDYKLQGTVGSTVPLARLATQGNVQLFLYDNVTTTGNQTYGATPAVQLAGDVTLTGNTASFTGGLNGATNDLVLNFSGLTTIDGSSTFANIGDLTSTGPTALNGTVQTIGNQTYSGNVSLIGATTLQGNAGTFSGTVAGGDNDLTLNFTAETTIDGSQSFANIANLTSLGDVALNGSIQTNGFQNYAANVSLAGDTNLTGTVGTFASGVTGNNNSLSFNFTGGTTSLAGLFTNIATLTADSDVSVNGTVETNLDQYYNANVTLGGASTFTGNAGFFSGAVEGGGNDLTLNFTQETTIDGSQTFANVANLTSIGDVSLNGTIATSGDQNYAANVTLAGTTTLAGNTGSFASGVAGENNSLTLNFSGGTTALSGDFANIQTLTALSNVSLNGGIQTNLDQNYAAGVSLAGDASLSGNAATFASGVAGENNSLTLNFTGGPTTLDGSFANIATLTALSDVEIAANISTNLDQNYAANVTLTDNATLSGNAGSFSSGVAGGGKDLTLNFTAPTALEGSFANLANLTSVGDVTLNGTIETTVDQTYQANVTLAGNTTLEGNAASFATGVTGENHAFTINFTGGTT
ncbi:MAG: S-layer family protein, partial [Planctomycetia bacterium]|nr:S-layer family protein [Planctomycetia bacterium]